MAQEKVKYDSEIGSKADRDAITLERIAPSRLSNTEDFYEFLERNEEYLGSIDNSLRAIVNILESINIPLFLRKK